MNRVLIFLPLLAAIAIGVAGWWGLNPDRDPNAIPSALVGKPVPVFDLAAVAGSQTPGLSTADIVGVDGPVMVNVFASWCLPCRAEHAVLSRLVRDEGHVLMGINYKDDPAKAAAWLNELGNPYVHIGSDLIGRAGIEWGISGVPETFVVDANGVVTFRYVGPVLTDEALTSLRQALSDARKVTP